MSNGNEENKMKLVCPQCQQNWSISAPLLEIVNNLRSSAVIIAHEKVVRCPNNKCRQPFIVGIAQAQIAFMVNGVTEDVAEQVEGSKLVKPQLEIVGGIS